MSDNELTVSLVTRPSISKVAPAGQKPDLCVQGDTTYPYVDIESMENKTHHLQSQLRDSHYQNVHLLQQTTPMVQPFSALTNEFPAVNHERKKPHATIDLPQHTEGNKYKHPAIRSVMEVIFELKAGNKALGETVKILKAKVKDLQHENSLWVKEKVRLQVEWWMLDNTIRENATLKKENEELRRQVAELQGMDIVDGKRKRAAKGKCAAGRAKPAGSSILDLFDSGAEISIR